MCFLLSAPIVSSAGVSIDHSQVSRYERGQMSSVGKNLHKICTFLQVDADPACYSLPRMTPGRQTYELLDLYPAYEPAIAKLLEALEGLRRVTHNANLVVNTDADQLIVAQCGSHRPATDHFLCERQPRKPDHQTAFLRNSGRCRAGLQRAR